MVLLARQQRWSSGSAGLIDQSSPTILTYIGAPHFTLLSIELSDFSQTANSQSILPAY
ncbi:MAG TPA: hypothetical protein PKK23_18475 [Nitrospirales bacterium]|nr:hypothetical protein [Nitrospirales bacterium]